MSGHYESMRWNACVHRLDLSLYSHLKEFFGGMKSEPMLTPREGSNPQRCMKQYSEPNTLPAELFLPPLTVL